MKANSVNGSFILAMQERLLANSHRGNWNKWEPLKDEALTAVGDQFTKLCDECAKAQPNRQRIIEISADVANYVSKVAEQAGQLPQSNLEDIPLRLREMRNQKKRP